ncbi:MAG: hypothetical protein ACRDTJ_26010 [Pseudonocardiaceae bacterium]
MFREAGGHRSESSSGRLVDQSGPPSWFGNDRQAHPSGDPAIVNGENLVLGEPRQKELEYWALIISYTELCGQYIRPIASISDFASSD